MLNYIKHSIERKPFPNINIISILNDPWKKILRPTNVTPIFYYFYPSRNFSSCSKIMSCNKLHSKNFFSGTRSRNGVKSINVFYEIVAEAFFRTKSAKSFFHPLSYLSCQIWDDYLGYITTSSSSVAVDIRSRELKMIVMVLYVVFVVLLITMTVVLPLGHLLTTI